MSLPNVSDQINGGTRWPKATPEHPCPNCGKSNRCKVAPDGTAAVCFRDGGKVKQLGPRPTGNGNGTSSSYVGAAHRPKPPSRIASTYDYSTRDGELLFQVCRMEPKGFRQRRPDGRGGWTWKLGDVIRVIYRFPEVVDADPADWVLVVEGEKDADRLAALGLVATTNAGGAGNWKPEYTESLRARRVCVFPDNDIRGRQHADAVARSLHGTAAEVRVVELPGLPPKGDVSDWLGVGGTAEQLLELADQATPWRPVNQVEQALDMPAAPRAEFALTDVGNGERLIDRHRGKLRFCARFRRWYAWSGTRYELDERGAVDQLAIESIRAMQGEAAGMVGDNDKAKRLFEHAMRCEANRKIKDMIERASKLPGVHVGPDELDADPWLFNAADATIELRTGEPRPHRQADLMTKASSVRFDPRATCPAFIEFLKTIFAGNDSLIRFVQRLFGYSLTGLTSERSLFIFWGGGANGKSTLLAVLRHVLGDYAIQAPAGVLMARRAEGIPNDIARMKGARMISAVETDEGRRIAEALIKQLTGGEDMLTGRFLYAEHFDFKPEFKLYVATNHKPEVRGTDDGVWDRVKLVPFGVRIAEEDRDLDLIDRLKAEAPGILAWAVQGCLDWQRGGLAAPAAVRAATHGYRAEMDRLGEFIADECVTGEGRTVGATDLYTRFKVWCQLRGEEPMTQTRFGRQLEERGFGTKRDEGTRRTLRTGICTRVSEA